MASNLEFISTTNCNSGATTLTVDNIFNHGYNIYFVTITGLQIDGNRSPYMRFLDSSGSPVTTANYDRASLAMFSGSGFGEYKGENQTEIYYIPSLYINGGLLNSFTSFYVYNAEDTSTHTYITAQGGDNVATAIGIRTVAGLKVAAAHRGIQFTVPTDDFIEGSITAYGVK